MVGEVSFPKHFPFHPKHKHEDPGPGSSLSGGCTHHFGTSWRDEGL